MWGREYIYIYNICIYMFHGRAKTSKTDVKRSALNYIAFPWRIDERRGAYAYTCPLSMHQNGIPGGQSRNCHGHHRVYRDLRKARSLRDGPKWLTWTESELILLWCIRNCICIGRRFVPDRRIFTCLGTNRPERIRLVSEIRTHPVD